MADTVNKTLVADVYTAITAAAESGTIHHDGTVGSVQIAEGAVQPAATIRGLVLNADNNSTPYSLAAGQIMYAKPAGNLNSISVTPS